MTKAAIKRAFEEFDPATKADVLRELAASLAESLAKEDQKDAEVFRRRRREEATASPLADVRRRLLRKQRVQ